MRRLNRATITVPDDWDDVVADKLPDRKAFYKKAAQFERKGINSDKRRAGFVKFAPEVLQKSGDKYEFPAVWRSDTRVKDAMETLSRFKCAYCECLINARRSEHVEHFKPKSLFPRFAYDWDNYFLACDGCNGTKLDKWPEKGEYVRPDMGTPEKLFEFVEDGSIKAVDDNSAAQQTITDFGLDRGGLQRERRIMIKMQLDDVRCLIAAGIAPDRAAELVRRKLELLESPATPCSIALSQNVRRAWHAAYPGIDL